MFAKLRTRRWSKSSNHNPDVGVGFPPKRPLITYSWRVQNTRHGPVSTETADTIAGVLLGVHVQERRGLSRRRPGTNHDIAAGECVKLTDLVLA